MNKKKIIYSVILSLSFVTVFVFGIWIGTAKIAYSVSQPDNVDFSLFWDAYNKLSQKFIDPSKITSQKIVYGAIKGMAESLGDSYTTFFDPDEAKKFEEDLSGSFGGIGLEVGIKNDVLTVIAPLKDTPAEKAGLESGDIITKINGKDTTDMSTEEAVNLIRGEKGTSVTLSVYWEEWKAEKEIIIMRDTITVPSIEWSMKGEDVAYIHIYQFDGTIYSDFDPIAFEIKKGTAKKIVLDLRDNPGGYLEAAQYVAGYFLDKGQTVAIEDFGQEKTQKIFKAEGSSQLSGYPLVVLINEGSASASEILAGALRDNKKVKLIGTKSFGKGCVQEVIDLEGGSLLKVTVANWLTPNGNSISNVGLTPDVLINITDKDAQAEKDPQLEKALEFVKDLK
jgi:carboxyl-terminal processing protease